MQVITAISPLNLSGNLQDLVLSAGPDEVVNIKLFKGAELLIEEFYKPDVAGHIKVKYKTIISDELNAVIPTFNLSTYHQSTGYADFKIFALNNSNQTIEILFRVIKGEVSTKLLDTSNFLDSNFLTWQPQLKHVQYHDPEWLTYYARKYCLLKITAYTYPGNIATTKTIAVLPAGELTTVNLNYGLVLSLFAAVGIPQYYDVFIERAGVRRTYVQRYVFSQEKIAFNDLFVFANSLGGIDTIRFTGEAIKKDGINFNKALFDEEILDYSMDHQVAIKKDTGYFRSKHEKLWSFDFFASLLKFKNQDGTLLRIYTEDPELESISGELANYDFTYIFSNNSEAMNLSREHQAPPLLQLDQDVDGGLFQMPPSINHYPFATSSDVIIPVQYPYDNKWRKLSLSDLLLGVLDPGDDSPSINLISGNFGVWTLFNGKDPNIVDLEMPLQFKADRTSFAKRGIVFLTGKFRIRNSFAGLEITLGTLPEYARPAALIQKYFITQNIEMFLEVSPSGLVKVKSKDGKNLPIDPNGHAYFIDTFFNPDVITLEIFTFERSQFFQKSDCEAGQSGTFVEFIKAYQAPSMLEAEALAMDDPTYEVEGQAYANDAITGGLCIIDPGTTIYTSIRSGSFSRECGEGFIGSSVVFTKEYSSTVSQAAANTKAANDTYNFNTLGLAFANNPENGATCTVDSYFIWGKITIENVEIIDGVQYADFNLRTYRSISPVIAPLPVENSEVYCSQVNIAITRLQDGVAPAEPLDFTVSMANTAYINLVPPNTSINNPKYPKQIISKEGRNSYCVFTGRDRDEMILLQTIN